MAATFPRNTLFSFILALTIFIFTAPDSLKADIGSWNSTTPLPYKLASHVSAIISNRLYIISGSAVTGQTRQEIEHSDINPDGSITSWNNSSNIPQPVIWHSSALHGQLLYILGGYPDGLGGNNNTVSNVYVSNNSNPISTWTVLNSLPNQLAQGAAVVVGDRLYFAGGFKIVGGSFSEFSNKIYVTGINPDGTIGSWTEAGSLPEALFGFGLIASNNKLTVVGGRKSNFGYISNVRETTLNPDGTIGSWTEKDALPQPVSRSGIAQVGSLVISTGGEGTGGSLLSNVYYTATDGTGSIGSWSESSHPLPTGICCGSLVGSASNLYYTGGLASDYLSTVYHTSLSSLPALAVPDIKQYSPPWNDNVYDQATLWSSNPTIARWGCALTSATMVLKFFGHTINPDTLNNWLKTQADGYVRNGLLNWLAVSRYTRLHDSPSSPTLEYRRLGAINTNLINELTAGRPGILEEPGHFVVGKNQLASSFGINDPAYSTRPTLNSYGNTFLSLGSYKPSHSDLSYLLLTTDGDVNITLLDQLNNPVSGDMFTQPPLTDDISNSITSGDPIKVFLLPTPPVGNYTVKLSGSPGSYQFDTYLYDQQGEVVKNSFSGLLTSGEEDKYQIQYQILKKTAPLVTIDTVIQDLEDGFNLGLVKRQAYIPLKAGLTEVKKLLGRNQKPAAKSLLKAIIQVLKAIPAKYIDPTASNVLISDIQVLIGNL